MKKVAIMVLMACCVAASAVAQSQEQRKISSQYACLLTVKQGVGTGKKQTDWVSYYGSRDTTHSKSVKYAVQVKWNSKEDADLSLEVIYMASSGKKAVPYSSETQDFSILGGAKTNFVFESPVLSFREYNTSYYANENRKSGYKIKGAIIRLKKGDDIIRTYVSQPFWAKMAWEPTIKVEVENTDNGSETVSYRDREKATEVRLSSQERPPAIEPNTDVSPRFFKAERSTEPARFKAQLRLSSNFYSDFHVFRDTHYCLEVSVLDSKFNRTHFYAYARKSSPLGQRIAEDFKKIPERDGTAVIRYPRNAKDDDGCFLDNYTLDE